MSLDHGLLNIPLSKRVGNIDAQIDKYKAEQEKLKQDRLYVLKEEYKKNTKQAFDLLATIEKSDFRKLAKHYKQSVPDFRMKLRASIKVKHKKGVELVQHCINVIEKLNSESKQ